MRQSKSAERLQKWKARQQRREEAARREKQAQEQARLREELAVKRQESLRERERSSDPPYRKAETTAPLTANRAVLRHAWGRRFGMLSLLVGLAVPNGVILTDLAIELDRAAKMKNARLAFAWLGVAIIRENPGQPMTAEIASDLAGCLSVIDKAPKGEGHGQ